MAKYQKKFNLEILTPNSAIFSGEVVSMIFPAADGQVGILGGHAPLVAILGSGRLTIEEPNEKRQDFFVAGGFAHVRENTVSIMAEQCVAVAQLDKAFVQAQLEKAGQMPSDNEEAIQRRKAAIVAANAMMKMVTQKK